MEQNKKYTVISSGISIQTPDPLDVRDRINSLSEVSSILNPDIGGIFYCTETKYYYTITAISEDGSSIQEYEIFTSSGAESISINNEKLTVNGGNVIEIPDDSIDIKDSIDLRNSNRINITKEYDGKLYSDILSAEEDLKTTLGKSISQELKDSVKMLCLAYGKTNTDSDRDIIKDISGNGNDLVLSGFSFTTDSGYGNKDWKDALVTDGVDDYIYSNNTIDTILGGSTQITVVSMMAQVSDYSPNSSYSYNNNIRYNSNSVCLRSGVLKDKLNKVGMYGYTCPDINQVPVYAHKVCTLGDTEDYRVQGAAGHNSNDIYSVVGYRNSIDGILYETSKVAWYWTFIADRVLTSDEIEKVIEYYNLDRSISPQIYYNVEKQGITNENHNDFSDKLLDFSGNGYDLQLYNLSWGDNSGIGRYISFGFDKYNIANWANSSISSLSGINNNGTSEFIASIQSTLSESIPEFKINITSISGALTYNYISQNTSSEISTINITSIGEYTLPESRVDLYNSTEISLGFVLTAGGSVNLNIIPPEIYSNALILNGVDDFGRSTVNLPILKDYTVIADRHWLANYGFEALTGSGGIVSKAKTIPVGEFILEQQNFYSGFTGTYSYATYSGVNYPYVLKGGVTYQSKYSYNNNPISPGTSTGSDTLWIGTIRDNDARFSKIAIWSILIYPYTLPEFLISRQLKRLGITTPLHDGEVKFSPEIISTGDYSEIELFKDSDNSSLNDYQGYLPIGTKIKGVIKSSENIVTEVTVSGVTVEEFSQNYDKSETTFYYTLTSSYPQKINLFIDEYIRYEDIKHPFPFLVNLGNKNYKFGDKLKVGDQMVRGNLINLMPNLYTSTGVKLDGNTIWPGSIITITKDMNFEIIGKEWLLDTDAPLYAFDPSLFNNSSLKRLGYLPDITGNGNNLVLHNFSYNLGSGANNYALDFQQTLYISAEKIKTSENIIEFISMTSSGDDPIIKFSPTSTTDFELVLDWEGDDILEFTWSSDGVTKEQSIQLIKGKNIIPSYTGSTSGVSGYLYNLSGNNGIKISIIQEGIYPGSLYFNGVLDYGEVSSLSHGGKCLVMKTNWNKLDAMLFDQRISGGSPFSIYAAIISTTSIAYDARNSGSTYIDNVLNNYIKSEDLQGVNHIATIVNNTVTNSNSTSPRYGISFQLMNPARMALYRTMLLPEIPSDSDRQILNDWAGIEGGYVEVPEYYYDAYGKTNSDSDRNTLVNIVNPEDNYSLTNMNFSYSDMSGYGGGRSVKLGSNKTWDTLVPESSSWDYILTEDSVNILKSSSSDVFNYSLIKNSEGVLQTTVTIPEYSFKVTGIPSGSSINCSYLATSDATDISSIIVMEDGIYTIPMSYPPTSSYQGTQSWVGVQILHDGVCDINIEIQEYYPNGLVFDGVNDYSVNNVLPVLNDYTLIVKAKDLYNSALSCMVSKGLFTTNGGNGFIYDYYSDASPNSYFSFGSHLINQPFQEIGYMTKTQVNDVSFTEPFVNPDLLGIKLGTWAGYGYKKMVFYKMMLFSKTINKLSIRMLMNLMKNDGIISLDNKLFKK